ncbi:glycosyltransferase family 2 protein [Niabella terrae]
MQTSPHSNQFEADAPLFSILIPSWNNLTYLKLCIESIRKNSSHRHQVIVHINEGGDGSLEWVETQKDLLYTYSEDNIGVCYALNTCSRLATTEYILYLNDDMYVCPRWDQHLFDEIKALGHKAFFISGSAIERVPQSSCSIRGDYGSGHADFREAKLLEEFDRLPHQDWSGATWPPNVVHRDYWDLVGGYSIEFSPGMYSDPDFSMKLWQAGIRHFKGLSKSRVYHFGSLSVKRVIKNNGYYLFILKWGMTSGTFTRRFLRRGSAFSGPLSTTRLNWALQLKSVVKQIHAIFKSRSLREKR